MIRSFRLRIALLVTLVAGVTLVGFSGAAWRLIYGAKVSQIDARLEPPLRRLTIAPSPAGRPPRELLRALRMDPDNVALQVRDQGGNLIYQSENWSADFAPPYPRSPQGRGRNRRNRPLQRGNARRGSPSPLRQIPIRTVTQTTSKGRWRIGAARSPSGQAAIAVSLQAINQEMAAIRTIFLVAVPGTLLLVAGGAWGLSGQALRPIRRLTQAMAQITVAGLHQRVSADTTDAEFADLITVFNAMLGRLERSFQQASRFSADAAHELKTPLAILQGELEQALQEAAPGSSQQQQLGSLLDEVRRLSIIVRKLLLLSLADAGQMALHKTQVNLSALMTEMVDDMELLAPHVQTEAIIAPQGYVWGDRDLLLQVLQNLMSNAIKYNRPEGWVRVQLEPHAQSIRVTIANASEGVIAGDRIFERFYRGDPARNRRVEGLGLGLSLSREITEAHGGQLVLDETAPGETQFTLTLPAAFNKPLEASSQRLT